MPRPTKRTEECQNAIIEAMTKGYTRKASAAFGGIAYSTMREWELQFPEFSEALEKAEGIAQNTLVSTIVRASVTGTVTTRPDGTVIESPGAWQAAAWVLERRWPHEYSQRQRVEMTGKDGGPIEHQDIDALPDHEKEVLSDVIRDELERRAALARDADAQAARPAVVGPVETGTEGT